MQGLERSTLNVEHSTFNDMDLNVGSWKFDVERFAAP
jgi:hypothetical protein